MNSFKCTLYYAQVICLITRYPIAGKNDGVVQGVRYFTSRPKHGIFVRADKLILDKRGRAMRMYKAQDALVAAEPLKRSSSRGDGLSTIHRSRSEGLSSAGRTSPRNK